MTPFIQSPTPSPPLSPPSYSSSPLPNQRQSQEITLDLFSSSNGSAHTSSSSSETTSEEGEGEGSYESSSYASGYGSNHHHNMRDEFDYSNQYPFISRSPSPTNGRWTSSGFGVRGSSSGSRNRSRGVSPNASGVNTPTRPGFWSEGQDLRAHHYQTSALLRKLGGSQTPEHSNFQQLPLPGLITHKQRKPGWWARRAESRRPSSASSFGGYASDSPLDKPVSSSRRSRQPPTCLSLFLPALLRQPWVPTQPLTILFSFLLLSLFAGTVTTFLIQILSTDKVPLPYRDFCTNQAPFPHALADSTAPVNVFVGVFSIDATYERRQLIRSTYLRHTSPGSNVVVKFILGRPRKNHARRVALEMEMYDDIVVLDEVENMNRGKTWKFFNWAAENATMPVLYEFQEGNGGRKRRGMGFRKPDYVVKADDDTFLMLGELERHLRITPREKTYWGYQIRRAFMAGEVYALSFDLVTYISTYTPLQSYTTGPEDKRVAKWMKIHPSAASISWISEKCWIYDHPKAGTTYSHGFLFPDEVERIKDEATRGVEEEVRLKRGGVLAGAWSSVVKWKESYLKPADGMTVEEEVEALIEGGGRWKWKKEADVGVGMDRIVFETDDQRFLGRFGQSSSLPSSRTEDSSTTTQSSSKVGSGAVLAPTLGRTTKFGKDLFRDPEDVEVVRKSVKRSLADDTEVEEDMPFYNQVESPWSDEDEEDDEVKKPWALSKLKKLFVAAKETRASAAGAKDSEEAVESKTIDFGSSSPPASPSKYTPSSTAASYSSLASPPPSPLPSVDSSTSSIDDSFHDSATSTEEEQTPPATSTYENLPTGQIRFPSHNYALPPPPSTRYLPPPTPRYDSSTLTLRSSRMLGLPHGGTVAVHFLKRSEWFLETALVFIGREKMWDGGVEPPAMRRRTENAGVAIEADDELEIEQIPPWDGLGTVQELNPIWGSSRMFGSPIVEENGFVSVGRPVRVPQGGEANLRVTSSGWRGGKLGFRLVEEEEGGLLVQ